MSKLYHCDVCGKSYKNSRSLSTHKYSYHSDIDPREVREKQHWLHKSYPISSSHLSTKISGVQEGGIQYPKNSSDSDYCSLLKIRADNLKERVFDLQLDSKDTERKLNTLQTSLEELDNLVKSNQSNVRRLRHMIDHKNAAKYKENDLKARDLLDDVIEIKTLVAEEQLEQIISDIPKIRQVLRYILEAMDLSNISEEEINLLTEISNMSKAEAWNFISNNFVDLVDIFSRLKPEFDRLIVSENEETESEDESDSELENKVNVHTNASASQQMGMVERSDSHVESESESDDSSEGESDDDEENQTSNIRNADSNSNAEEGSNDESD
jgi:hypothetical protein